VVVRRKLEPPPPPPRTQTKHEPFTHIHGSAISVCKGQKQNARTSWKTHLAAASRNSAARDLRKKTGVSTLEMSLVPVIGSVLCRPRCCSMLDRSYTCIVMFWYHYLVTIPTFH